MTEEAIKQDCESKAFERLAEKLKKRFPRLPIIIVADGRKAGADSFMWVYRNGACDAKHPVVIYDYQKTRCTEHPEEFLKNYSGVVVTDGYQVYHSLEKRRSDIQISGCWVHAKPKFAELVKATGTDGLDGTIAAKASKQISELFHLDGKLDDLSKTEREKQRQLIVKPKVDDFFAWAKEISLSVAAGSTTYKGLQYCINQEQYLRVFLSNGNIPMDNSRAEQQSAVHSWSELCAQQSYVMQALSCSHLFAD